MNAIMNEKGRQTKLLAAIAVLAMVVCALAAVMPSDNVDAASYGEPVEMNQTEFNKLVSAGNGVITVEKGTTWNLTGDIKSDNVSIVLNADLKIQNTGNNNYKFEIAYNGDAAQKGTTAAAAITTSGAESAVNLYIYNVDATFDNKTTNASWTINSVDGRITVTIEDSNVNINKTAQYVDGTGSIWQTAANTTTLNVVNSNLTFTSNGQGIQSMLLKATEKSKIVANVKEGTLSVYADLDNSSISGTNIGLYAAKLVKSSVTATENLGVYTGNADVFTDSGLTKNTIVMDADSSVSGKSIIDDISKAGLSKGAGTNTAVFQSGSVSGTLMSILETPNSTAVFKFTNEVDADVSLGDSATVDNSSSIKGAVSAEVDDPESIASQFGNGATEVTLSDGTLAAGETYEVPENKTLIIRSGVSTEVAENGKVPTIDVKASGAKASVQNINGATFTVNGAKSATGSFENFSGTATFSAGSVVINGQEIKDGKYTMSGDTTIEGEITGDFEIECKSGTLSIPADKKLTIADGATLTLTGFKDTISIDAGTLDIIGSLFGSKTTIEATQPGKIVTYPSTNLSSVTLSGNIEYKTDNIAYEFKGMLDQDIIISTEQSLTGDLWIPEGVTLTIASGGVLNMAGYGIYVQGTLDVQANGAIKSIGNGYNDGKTVGLKGQILLHKDGTITNDGVIGSGSEVTVSADIKEKNQTPADVYDGTLAGAGLEVNYSGVGSVTMQNVTGIAFSVNTDGDNRVLTISGEAYSYGISAPYSISADRVNIEKTMTIGEDVTFTAEGEVNIKSGATLNIEGTVVSGGNVVMKNGSTVNVEGTIDEITAETGNFVTAQKYKDGSTRVTFTNVTGVVLTVGQTTYTEKNTSYTNQILYIAGNPSLVSDTSATGTLDVNNTDKGISYVAEDVKIVLDEGITFNMGGTEVFGEVSYPKVNTPKTGASDFVGTEYTIKGATASDDDVVYITTFANAYSQIANADKTTIKVWGKLTIDFDVTLAEKQTIDIREATVEIDADATVVVQRNGAIINNSIEDVQGVLTVYNGGNVKQPANYAVYKKTTDYVQYSGLVPAINNAQPGDVIDVRNSTTVKDDLTIPAGVTVNNKNTLTFMEDLTIAETAVLNNEGTIYMAGEKSTVTVEGTFDNKDGSTFGFYDVSGEAPVLKTENAKGENRALYSTGTTIIDENTRLNILNFANAAYYNDEDGNVVLTTVAKAVAAVEAQDAGEQSVVITGTINQSENITLADGTVVIVLSGAKATLGTVTLSSGAAIASYGELTATITGQTGVEGSTIDSTIELSKAGALIGMISHTSNDNVTTDYLVMFDGIKGDVTISAGKVNVLNSVDENDATIEFTVNGTTLNVSEGATLAVEKIGDMNATLVAGVGEKADQPSIIVDGTLLFDDGSLEAHTSGQHITVNGTMTVADETEITIDGTVEIIGTLAVSTTEDKAGVVSIADGGVLIVGDKPTDLGVAGSGVVSGAVESDNGIIKAYNGADLSGAQIDVVSGESEAKSTAFYINGELYMTVYSCNVRQVADIVGNEEFDIVGYVTERDSTSNPLDIGDLQYWYTDAEMSQKADKVTDLGSPEALYFKAPAAQVTISVSVGEGISLYIDDVRQVTNSVTLAVGTHTVSATVDPGFKGEVTVTFNGVAVNGTFTITPEMASNAYDGPLAISAAGNITQDSTVVIDGGNQGGSDMGLTDYLLIVLVILIVIMAIIVALRLMRS